MKEKNCLKYTCFISMISYISVISCKNDIDDCTGMCTGPYVDPNSKLCKDLLNDYQCICKAGYTGKTCNVSLCEVAYIYFFLFNMQTEMWYNCERYNYTSHIVNHGAFYNESHYT